MSGCCERRSGGGTTPGGGVGRVLTTTPCFIGYVDEKIEMPEGRVQLDDENAFCNVMPEVASSFMRGVVSLLYP
jgi:hypothetical protein